MTILLVLLLLIFFKDRTMKNFLWAGLIWAVVSFIGTYVPSGQDFLTVTGFSALIAGLLSWVVLFLTTEYHLAKKENKNLFYKFLCLISIIPALVIGEYGGINIIVPILVTTLISYLINKYAGIEAKRYTPAIALLAGQTVWISLGLLIASLHQVILLELMILISLLAALSLRPGKISVAAVGLYELIVLILNIVKLNMYNFGTIEHRALIVHVTIEVLIITALLVGLNNQKIIGTAFIDNALTTSNRGDK